MALNLGDDVIFEGPALPEAFVRHELEKQLGPSLPKEKVAEPHWDVYRRAIRQPLTGQSGRWRVKNVVLDPLAALLGYQVGPVGDPVVTREGAEGPGLLPRNGDVTIRAFPVDYLGDLDAPVEQGQTYRFTPERIARRILLATGERVGLLTNGDDLRLLLSDPARPGSHVTFKLNVCRSLSARERVPDGFRLLLALLDSKLLAPQKGKDGERPSRLQDVLDAARLKQGQITRDLRLQARRAVEQFIQGVLDHPANRERFAAMTAADRERLPHRLWREGLILVYRLLFILRGEASGAFRFAATSPWRHTYSPGSALADVARQVLDHGADTGQYLEQSLRKLFAIFEKGLHWKEAHIWDALTPGEQKGFAPDCPDFVIELRSPTDRLRDVHDKMREYRTQETRLGWLIDPKRNVVEVYRPRRRVEILTAPATLSGENVLPGFVLDLKGILN